MPKKRKFIPAPGFDVALWLGATQPGLVMRLARVMDDVKESGLKSKEIHG